MTLPSIVTGGAFFAVLRVAVKPLGSYVSRCRVVTATRREFAIFPTVSTGKHHYLGVDARCYFCPMLWLVCALSIIALLFALVILVEAMRQADDAIEDRHDPGADK